MMGGAYVLARARSLDEEHAKDRRYWWFGVLGFVFGALSSLLDRFILAPSVLGSPERPPTPEAYLLWSRIFLTAGLLVWMRMRYGDNWAILSGWRTHGALIITAAAIAVVGVYAYLLAVASAPVGPIIVLMRLQPLLVTVVGGELFHEHHLGRKILAGALMLGGVIALVQ
jgi:drug/metabolite transporter (DMT)-like permease